jgi:hypothetical protein
MSWTNSYIYLILKLTNYKLQPKNHVLTPGFARGYVKRLPLYEIHVLMKIKFNPSKLIPYLQSLPNFISDN